MLRQLPSYDDPNLLVGPEHHSDAGVYRVGENLAIVQTVDFFPPLTDDPYDFGQIAAANSLSDVYAMGGRPVSALNIVGFPDDKLPLDILNEILRGGAEKAHEAGAAVLGGHTVRDVEIKYGLSVTGLIDPKQLITNAKARPGDVLVLSKPIGTGAMTSAFKSEKIDKDVWENCCTMMRRLNRDAAEAMVKAGASAATDITGFGLLGHASELAEASGVTVEIEAAAVPLLDGAMELSKADFITRAASTNQSYLDSRLERADGIDPTLYNLLLDAQTSGGLLIALAESKLDVFSGAMSDAGVGGTWSRVGRITEKGDAAVRLI